MAHNETKSFVKTACDNESNMLKIQFFAPGSFIACICSTSSSSHKSQTHLDVVQSIKECLQESFIPQIRHASEADKILWWSGSVDGSDCCARSHRNTFSFEGTLIFHKVLHDVCFLSLCEVSSRSSSHASQRSLVKQACDMQISLKRPHFSQSAMTKSPISASYTKVYSG